MTQVVPVVFYGPNNLATVIGEAEVQITQMELGYNQEQFTFGALVMRERQMHPEDAIATAKNDGA